MPNSIYITHITHYICIFFHFSGGIQRDWAGVPRQYYEVASKSYRCACVATDNEVVGNLREYPGCESDSSSCFIKTEKH